LNPTPFFLFALLAGNAIAATGPVAAPHGESSIADFKRQSASADVREVAQWVLASKDNHGLPFVIIDKVEARVFVFDAIGRLQGTDFALLGMARGDTSNAGIGKNGLSGIRPQDRTTPAGRFNASLSRDAHGKEVLMIDYAASITLHAVVRGTPVVAPGTTGGLPSPEGGVVAPPINEVRASTGWPSRKRRRSSRRSSALA